MKNKIKLSIVIVNYNTDKYLSECVKSVYNNKLPQENFEIIIIDNASASFPKAVLQEKFPKLKIIVSRKNIGFAKANNIGINSSCGDYILLLNPDTVLSTDTLAKMLEYIENNPRVGIATCKVLMQSGELDDACHRGFPTPLNALFYFSGLSDIFPKNKIINGYHLGYQNMDKTHEIDSCAGAFMIIRRQAGEEMDWLDEDYFWYGEDIDICYKMKQRNWKIMYVPTTSITHYKGVSAGIKKHIKDISTADNKTQIYATIARFEAMRIFYEKHYQKNYPKWTTFIVMISIRIKKYLSLKMMI